MKTCVLWATEKGLLFGVVNCLTYGDKSIRTYNKGQLDPRCGDIPFAETVEAFITHIRQHPDNPCEVPVTVASNIIHEAVFAD